MKSPISAPKILLMGPGGSGKTYALRTLAAAGVTPFIMALDGQGLEAISDVPDPDIHWHNIKGPHKSLSDMADDARRLSNFTAEGIAGANDAYKSRQTRWIDMLEALKNFKCDRCGEEFGPFDTWGTHRALVFDHFSEMCQASKEWAVGNKLVLHKGEWQVAMNNVENLVRWNYNVPRCWVITLAHMERELNEVLGGNKIMVSALGAKLAPKLPPLFSDVIMSVRVGKDFQWDAVDPTADLKTRNFPIEKMLPNFSIGVERWKSRGGIIEAP